MADVNVQGHLAILLQVWQSKVWHEIWAGLGLAVEDFEALGLARNAPDSLVWQACQDRQIILITANRNDDGPDSLESTIRDRNGPASLPVFTLANARRLKHDAAYAARTAVALLEHFLDIDRLRGTGRLYVP